MIENPNEEYPWERNPKDEYEVEVKDAIEKEMYDYDQKYIDWLNDYEFLPCNQSLMTTTLLYRFCDILTEVEEVKDMYYEYRKEDMLQEIIQIHS